MTPSNKILLKLNQRRIHDSIFFLGISKLWPHTFTIILSQYHSYVISLPGKKGSPSLALSENNKKEKKKKTQNVRRRDLQRNVSLSTPSLSKTSILVPFQFLYSIFVEKPPSATLSKREYHIIYIQSGRGDGFHGGFGIRSTRSLRRSSPETPCRQRWRGTRDPEGLNFIFTSLPIVAISAFQVKV